MPVSQQLLDVQSVAVQLMAEHQLFGWTLSFDNARHRAGQCRRRAKEISLSAPLMSIWTIEQCTDTILHEIAHALTSGGHDEEWQAMCVKIGADPTRTWGHLGEQRLPPKWTGRCPNGHETHRDRVASKAVSCGVCSPRFDRRYLITWTRNA